MITFISRRPLVRRLDYPRLLFLARHVTWCLDEKKETALAQKNMWKLLKKMLHLAKKWQNCSIPTKEVDGLSRFQRETGSSSRRGSWWGFHVVWKWEVRDCQWLSHASICASPPQLLLFSFSVLTDCCFPRLHVSLSQFFSPLCVNLSVPLTAVWPTSFSQHLVCLKDGSFYSFILLILFCKLTELFTPFAWKLVGMKSKSIYSSPRSRETSME